jgi:hypothetical protein
MKHKKARADERKISVKTRPKIPFIAYAVICLVLLFSFFQIYRKAAMAGVPAGEEAYYHERIAKAISEKGIITEDALSFSGRPYIFNIYHYLLAIAGKAVGISAAAAVLPLLMAIAALLAFYGIMKEAKISDEIAKIAVLIAAATPAFAYFSLVSNSQIMAAAFILSAFYFYMRGEKFSFAISAVLFGLSAFSGFTSFIASAAMAGFYTLKHPENKKKFLALLPVFAVASAAYILTAAKLGFPAISFGRGLDSIVLELGAISGIGIFEIIISGIGFITAWNMKEKSYLPSGMAVIFIIAFLFGVNVSIYLSFICAFFSASAIAFLFERKWSVPTVKNASLVLIFCGLLFSMLTFVDRSINMAPSQKTIESFAWLSGRYSGGNVLSEYGNGFYIEYFGMNAFTDSNFIYAPNLAQRLNSSSIIFYSRDLQTTRSEIEKNNITYIVITPEMKNGRVWKKEKEGLLFLLRNNETFRNIYSAGTESESIEIWEYLPQKKGSGLK